MCPTRLQMSTPACSKHGYAILITHLSPRQMSQGCCWHKQGHHLVVHSGSSPCVRFAAYQGLAAAACAVLQMLAHVVVRSKASCAHGCCHCKHMHWSYDLQKALLICHKLAGQGSPPLHAKQVQCCDCSLAFCDCSHAALVSTPASPPPPDAVLGWLVPRAAT
jgi:hypothetical protein